MKFKIPADCRYSVLIKYVPPINLANLTVGDQQGRFSPKHNAEAEILAIGIDVKDFKVGNKIIVQSWALTNAFEYEGHTYSRTHEDNVICIIE